MCVCAGLCAIMYVLVLPILPASDNIPGGESRDVLFALRWVGIISATIAGLVAVLLIGRLVDDGPDESGPDIQDETNIHHSADRQIEDVDPPERKYTPV